ncbi:MAG: S41 family peptidase [Bacteroidales bacterium]|nr:S41 family peptidase [Bacteroidales bacterium]MDY6036162.1 S41 family peptidase [Paludibacteraceae bacterium]
MNTKRIATYILAIMCTIGMHAQDKYARIANSLEIYNAVMRELSINYVDTIDYEQINQAGINYMLQKLDPYTTFFAESEEDALKMMTTGTYGGIGAIISRQGANILIAEPYEGMPAQRHDIRAGDIIVEVDGKSTKGLQTGDVSQMLRGPQGTEVELLLQRPGEKKTFRKKIIREVIQINPVEYYGMLTDTIGYIALRDFTDKAYNEVRDAVIDLTKNHNMRKLIIDLRSNGGGLVSEAVNIAGLFVPRHTHIVSTKGLQPQSHQEYVTSNEPLLPDLPLMVLINSASASASEILAGALQDLDRAIVVGERSYGKGLVQSLRPLPHNTYLKVTTAKYYIPSGRCVQAIDYAKRNSDGSIQRIPDSLTHEFTTRNGRKVRDGGGIMPDSTLKRRDDCNIVYELYVRNLFFDYATNYARTHKSIAAPERFALTDAEYDDFINYVKAQNFTYELQSAQMLDEVRQVVKSEGYATDADTLLVQLATTLKPDIDRDLRHFRQSIEEVLGSEIVKRYYFQKGTVAYELRFDQWLHQAIDLFNDDRRCADILK